MEKLSILFPRQEEVTYREIPEESWHDLGLDAITEKVAAKPQEVPLIRRVMMNLTADPRVAAFRIDVFDDILRHPEIREKMLKLLDKVQMFYDYGVVNRHTGDEASIWDLMHRLEEYHDYIITVEAIRECLAERDLKSEGLTALRDTVNRIYEEKGFAALKKDVEEMRITASEIRSLTVGINVNDRFEAISMGLVSVNGKAFTRSGLLKNFLTAVTPRDEIRKEAEWNGNYSYYPANTETGLLESVQQHGNRAAGIRATDYGNVYDPAQPAGDDVAGADSRRRRGRQRTPADGQRRIDADITHCPEAEGRAGAVPEHQREGDGGPDSGAGVLHAVGGIHRKAAGRRLELLQTGERGTRGRNGRDGSGRIL